MPLDIAVNRIGARTQLDTAGHRGVEVVAPVYLMTGCVTDGTLDDVSRPHI